LTAVLDFSLGHKAETFVVVFIILDECLGQMT